MPELLLREIGPQQAEVSKAWAGKTVVCIACGPSLTSGQVQLIRAARERDAIRVIVINDGYLVAPWADACYFADEKWWRWHKGGLAKSWPWVAFTAEQVRAAWAEFGGQKVTIKHTTTASEPGLFVLQNGGDDGLSADPKEIRTGLHSGFQVVQIAALSGGNPILLVAYDGRFNGGRSHAHNGHPEKTAEGAYREYSRAYRTVETPLKQAGIRVLNCTPGSAITAFPQADLASVLAAAA